MRPRAISRSTVFLDTESNSAASLMVLSMGSGFTSLEQTIDGGSEMDPFIGIDPDHRRRSSGWDLLATRCADCRHQQIRARSQWAACLAWVAALAFVAFVVAFAA